MTAQLKIDQAGLPEGEPGVSRTDGLATGATVTLTNMGAGSSTAFVLLWAPPGDWMAADSLAPTDDPKVWTFSPLNGKYGSYLVELVENAGLISERRERRVIAMRTPHLGLVVPALGERGASNASFVNVEAELVDNNATDFGDSDLNERPYAAWWRSMHEFMMAVDAAAESWGGGGGGLPPGSFLGQATVWDGSSWIPLESEQPLVVDRFQSPTSMLFEPTGEYRVTAAQIFLDATPFGGGALNIDGGSVTVTATELGFFDAVPSARPSISSTESIDGALEQLIAALVTLGLITDDR